MSEREATETTGRQRCLVMPSDVAGHRLHSTGSDNTTHTHADIHIDIHAYNRKVVYGNKDIPQTDNDQLTCMLIDCLAQLSQDTLNQAIDQLLKD